MKTIHIVLLGLLSVASAEELGSGFIPQQKPQNAQSVVTSGSIDIDGFDTEATEGSAIDSSTVPTSTLSASTSAVIKIGGGTDDEDDDGEDFYMSGEGSGPPHTSKQDVSCIQTFCYCIDMITQEIIAASKTYLQEPSDCSQYQQEPTTPQIATAEAVTAMETRPTEVVVDTVKPTVVPVRTSSVKSAVVLDSEPTTTVSNKIEITYPKDIDIDEKEEEETNEISGISRQIDEQVQVDREDADSLSHPGILAAIIAAGVVALLCAVLLIMFIVYRMRKKDEGSYPLDDSKPPRLNTYTKSSNREFYA